MDMTVFLYKWIIKSGKEKQFEENWAIVTRAIREQCELDSSSSQARLLMREAVEFSYPDQQLDVKIDLLVAK